MIDYDSLLKNINKVETCKLLHEDKVKALDYAFFSKGIIWEINTEITYKKKLLPLILYLNFPNDFPYLIPKIFIQKESYEHLKYIPHVNMDLSICIFDEGLNNIIPFEKINEIVEYIIHKAKQVIQLSENEDLNIKEFKREFKAYWEISYSKKDKISNSGLHLVTSFDLDVKAIKFNKNISGYQYVIYNKGNLWDKFKKYLKYRDHQYDEIDVVVIEKPFRIPPFNITFKQSLKILKKNVLGFRKFKKSIRKSSLDSTLIIFSNVINGNIEIYGWTYKDLITPLSTLKGTRRGLANLEIINHFIFGKSYVHRMIFDNLTEKRLQLRTSGITEKNRSIAMSGVGSVGSNLIYFLKNLSVNKFNLIDNDLLKLENINRHYSGFNYINDRKVDILKDQMIISNPFCDVNTETKSVITVIKENPSFIDDCDFHIVSIGKTMIENFILQSIKEKILTKPTVFFWVEPYLASGQMLFVNPKDTSKALTLVNNFKYYTLDNDLSNIDKTYIIEGSCQTGYFPYSSTYLLLFLSAVFPYLKSHLLDENMTSTIYTWVGDKEFLKSKYLKVSAFAEDRDYQEIIINKL